MRFPPLAIVLIVSSALFAWHGFDKYQTFRQLHIQSLDRALERAKHSVRTELDHIQARGQSFEQNSGNSVERLRRHFPLATLFALKNYPDTLKRVFGTPEAEQRCFSKKAHPTFTSTRLCTAATGAPILEILRTAHSSAPNNLFVRYADDWLEQQLQLLNMDMYQFSANTGIRDDPTRLVRNVFVPGTDWIISAHSDDRSIIAQRNEIAREVTLALAVFLLLAATGMRFIRKTEKRESRLEQLLSNAMQATGESVWEYDFRTDTISVPFNGRNHGAQDSQSYSASQWLQLIHPRDRETVADILRAIQQSKQESVHCECRIRDSASNWVWAEIRGNLSERNDQGEPLRAIGVTSDISNRKGVERRLHYLASQTANTTGNDFFDSLILALDKVTSLSHAFIAELDKPCGSERHTLSFLGDGELLPATSLAIATTPCEILFSKKKMITIEDNLTDQFPHCELLKKWAARSYIGIPLQNAAGEIIGNIALFDRNPLQIDKAVLNALRLYSQRVGAELERRRTERRHNEREQLLAAICDNSPVGINVIDRDGVTLLANSRSIRNANGQMVLNEEVLELQSKRVIDRLYSNVLEAGQTITCEIDVNSDQGHIDTLLFIVFPLFDDQGKVSRVGSITPSVAHVRSVERDLSSERERARVTLESIADAVVTINAWGEIDYMNPVAETLTGIEKADAFGRRFDEVFNIMTESMREQIDITTLFDNRSLPVLRDDCILKTGIKEYSIRLSAAPIRNTENQRVGVVVALSDTTQTRLIARRMAYQATHDALTGLDNRRQFENRLDQAILGARAHGNQHVLCYIDLDQFKLVNDDAGHIAGDALLKQIAALLSSKLRSRDMLARIGGDEFALLLENCPLEKANSIALNIVNAVAAHRFEWQGKTYRCGASIGITAINSYAENREQILSQADIACYAAKDQGRNQINVYQEDGSEPARRHTEIRLAADIRDALEEDRFHLHIQPIVDMRIPDVGQRIVRCEVLLRMRGKHNDVITPNAFIPAAERYNLMADVDRWVIEKTLKSCAELAPADKQFEVGINLSGSSLSDETLLDFVQTQLLKYGSNNVHICFEVTETAAISNLPNAHQFIGYMRKMGCRFALDDFGTGLSSFSYLKSLPVDYLKIDGSFIRDIDRDPVDSAIVDSILQISRILKVPVIAEYAEREETVEHLRKMGVDYVQGTALGAPCPLETYFKRESKAQVHLHPAVAPADEA